VVFPSRAGGSPSTSSGSVIAPDKMSQQMCQRYRHPTIATVAPAALSGTKAAGEENPTGYHASSRTYTGTRAIRPSALQKSRLRSAPRIFAPIGMIGNAPHSLVDADPRIPRPRTVPILLRLRRRPIPPS